MNLYNVVYEITRRCNATCEHCLRGDAQNVDMSDAVIDASLEGIDSICTVTFTGGEPSLAVDRIEYFLEAVKRRGISVDSFCVVTNGKVASLELCLALMKMYAYCGEYGNEATSLCISKDQYHTNDIGDIDEADRLYKALTFYHPDARTDDIKTLIDEGRAHDMSLGERTVEAEYEFERGDEAGTIDHIGSTVYINALGDVVPCCDMSYTSQKKHKIGSVLQNTIEKIYARHTTE